MMKYLSLYFLSPPIATLLPQTTIQLVVLKCLDFRGFKDSYDEISKFIFCSSSPIAIATFQQMTLKLMLLACFCQRWNMEYLI